MSRRNHHNRLIAFYESSRYELSTSAPASWNTVRDLAQKKQPFAIFTFDNTDVYEDVIRDLDKLDRFNYFKQKAWRMKDQFMKSYEAPSIFLWSKDNSIQPKAFFAMMKDSIEYYKLNEVILGYETENRIHKYVKGESEPIVMGEEIVSTLSVDEMEMDEFFQVDSTYYKFITI